MTEALLPARFLFRFSVPCRPLAAEWSKTVSGLADAHRLPDLGQLEARPPWAELWAGWSAAGLAFACQVRGKQQPAWCRASRTEDSDGVQLWIDTRDVHNVHRANRYCHRFLFMPAGAGRRQAEAHGQLLPIHRAREEPRPVDPRRLQVRCATAADGYRMEMFLPAETLTGFDPQEYPRLGFTYAVSDRELGQQTFGPGRPMPFDEDPSLWATLELA